MVRKKKEDEVEETIAAGDEGVVEETAVEAAADDAAPVEEAPVEAAAAEAAPVAEDSLFLEIPIAHRL